MANFILTKTKKGAKNLYQIINPETNEVVAQRQSAHDYVASTANGKYYFGRKDLIGKGDHGRCLRDHTAGMNRATESAEFREYCKKVVAELSKIAYLQD